MSDGCFYTIGFESQSEIIVKKSRFICTLINTETKEESEAAIAGIKKKHYNATHNCSAAVIGYDSSYRHSSDDGEPQGTAGVPILEALVNNSLTYITAVVTRYFGGILLGASGLIRAYSGCTAEAIKNAVIIKNIPSVIYSTVIEYADYSKLQSLSHAFNAKVSADFLEKVYALIELEKNGSEAFGKQFTEAFNGKAGLSFSSEGIIKQVL